jgi:hypothetical protein
VAGITVMDIMGEGSTDIVNARRSRQGRSIRSDLFVSRVDLLVEKNVFGTKLCACLTTGVKVMELQLIA